MLNGVMNMCPVDDLPSSVLINNDFYLLINDNNNKDELLNNRLDKCKGGN